MRTFYAAVGMLSIVLLPIGFFGQPRLRPGPSGPLVRLATRSTVIRNTGDRGVAAANMARRAREPQVLAAGNDATPVSARCWRSSKAYWWPGGVRTPTKPIRFITVPKRPAVKRKRPDFSRNSFSDWYDT